MQKNNGKKLVELKIYSFEILLAVLPD